MSDLVQELIVVKDGAIDRVPIKSSTKATHILGYSKKTGKSYGGVIKKSILNTVVGKSGGAYVIGEDIHECVTLYNEYMQSEIDNHEKRIAHLTKLKIEVSCNG